MRIGSLPLLSFDIVEVSQNLFSGIFVCNDLLDVFAHLIEALALDHPLYLFLQWQLILVNLSYVLLQSFHHGGLKLLLTIT